MRPRWVQDVARAADNHVQLVGQFERAVGDVARPRPVAPDATIGASPAGINNADKLALPQETAIIYPWTNHSRHPMDFVFLPSLSSFMTVEPTRESTHHATQAHLAPEHREYAAFRVALDIAVDRCGGAQQYLRPWVDRYQGGPPHQAQLLECLEAFLGSESIGTPGEPANEVHLQGFVAEHIWHLLIAENALGFGWPVRIDGPDWSVTDSGGDGLALYRIDGALAFRLWESKAHTGTGEVRDVVNRAGRQIASKALRYLARFSKVGQSFPDEELQIFYGRLPELWNNADRAAGGGISVATASGALETSFDGFPGYWSFTEVDQRQGLLIVIDEFAGFARAVREHLWKGL